MATGDYLPDGETQFAAWFDNFTTQCEKFEAELGLNVTTLGVITGLNTTYDNKLAEAVTAKEDAKAATTGKNIARKNATQTIRSYANQWKSNPAIDPTILSALGIVAPSQSGPVTMVTNLNVTGCGDGINKLTWSRNGNAQGTSFIIESRVQGTAAWVFTASTTKASFSHTNQIPGVQVWYRIISTRAGVNAGPCPQVSVYGQASGNGLELAA